MKISTLFFITSTLALVSCIQNEAFNSEADITACKISSDLRQGTPVGEKIEFKDGKQGTYDFSDSLRKLHTGAQIGASWQAFNHFNLKAIKGK